MCVCVCVVWPLEGDSGAGMTELSVDTDDEGEENLSTALSTNPILLRKWLGSVPDISAYTLYSVVNPTIMMVHL